MDMNTEGGGRWAEVVEGIEEIKGDGKKKIKNLIAHLDPFRR